MHTKTLSLLMGAVLVLPSLAIAAPTDTNKTMPADMRTASADNTLADEIEGSDGEVAVASADNETVTDAQGDDEAADDTAVVDAVALQPAQRPQALNMQHSDANYQPLIVGEKATDGQATAATITLKEKKKDKRGELLATQPADVEFKENRRIMIAR